MGREDLERAILGALRLNPVLLEGEPELNAGLFDGRFREIFEGITAIWEESEPEEIDEVTLAGRMKGGCPVHYISALTDGRQRIRPAAFHDQVRELQLEKGYYRLMREAGEAVKLYTAIGTRDPSGLDAARAEYRRLERSGGPLTVELSAIEPKALTWLWRGWLPGAMFTLIVGDSGVGKSFFSVDLAARLSRGGPFPDGAELKGGPCETLFIADEDPVAEAIRPRLDACFADCSKITLLKRSDFCVTDTATLRAVLRERPGIRLVVFDPLTAYFPPKTDIFKAPSVHSALDPLIIFADETRVAVLGICYFRKAEVETIIHKVGGSTALAAIARSIISVTTDEEDRRRRLALPMKCSYAERPAGLAFRIAGDPPRIEFEEAPVVETAEDVLSNPEARGRAEKRNRADEFIMKILHDGPRDLEAILKDAQTEHVAESTLYRAAKRLRIEKVPHGFGASRSSTWSLPRA